MTTLLVVTGLVQILPDSASARTFVCLVCRKFPVEGWSDIISLTEVPSPLVVTRLTSVRRPAFELSTSILTPSGLVALALAGWAQGIKFRFLVVVTRLPVSTGAYDSIGISDVSVYVEWSSV